MFLGIHPFLGGCRVCSYRAPLGAQALTSWLRSPSSQTVWRFLYSLDGRSGTLLVFGAFSARAALCAVGVLIYSWRQVSSGFSYSVILIPPLEIFEMNVFNLKLKFISMCLHFYSDKKNHILYWLVFHTKIQALSIILFLMILAILGYKK